MARQIKWSQSLLPRPLPCLFRTIGCSVRGDPSRNSKTSCTSRRILMNYVQRVTSSRALQSFVLLALLLTTIGAGISASAQTPTDIYVNWPIPGPRRRQEIGKRSPRKPFFFSSQKRTHGLSEKTANPSGCSISRSPQLPPRIYFFTLFGCVATLRHL